MSDTTSVSGSQMQQGIADLQAAHSAVEQQLSELEQQVGAKLAEWEGSAREAYNAAKAQWDASAQHMSSVIQTMHTTLTGISDNYDSNERGVASSWG